MTCTIIKATLYSGKRYLLLLLLIISQVPDSRAYSVLTHEAIIDASWKTSLEPSICKKFPLITQAQLEEAHSYAYGGAIIPDIGYFPFGSKLFTNLVHYVRTGDFVTALLEEAQDPNEYAFALGVLAHYIGDNYGHAIGTNPAVPLVYPKMKTKFGDTVTYADDRKTHSRMEFGFDVLEIAKGNYGSHDYHKLIGFQVSELALKKAFFRTYGLDIRDVFGSLPVAVGTFRWSVKTLIPAIARSAWVRKKPDIRKTDPSASSRRFSYRMKRRMYYQEFGRERQKPGITAALLAFVTPILPKIGPLSKLKFKTPTPEAEKLFIKSFDTVLVKYAAATRESSPVHLLLANRCLDTGESTSAGSYLIADNSYDDFLLKLREQDFDNLKPEVRANLILFYSGRQFPQTKKARRKYAEIIAALQELKLAATTGSAEFKQDTQALQL